MMDANTIFNSAQERIKKLKLPTPTPPKGDDPLIEFPRDPSEMTSTELSQKMFRAAAWFGYTIWLLGKLDSELVAVDAEYSYRVNVAGNRLREDTRFKNRSGEIVEAEALYQNPEELSKLAERRVELRSVRPQLETRAQVYEKLYSALSREQSRRDSETRVSG